MDGNLSIRLEDNNMLILPSVNSDLSYVVNSQVDQGAFSLTKEQMQKLKFSKLKVVSLQLGVHFAHADPPVSVYADPPFGRVDLTV